MHICPQCGREINEGFCPVCFLSLHRKRKMRNRRLWLRLIVTVCMAAFAAGLLGILASKQVFTGSLPIVPIESAGTSFSTSAIPDETTAVRTEPTTIRTTPPPVATTKTSAKTAATTRYPLVTQAPEAEVQRILEEKLDGIFRRKDTPYGLFQTDEILPLGYTAKEVADALVTKLCSCWEQKLWLDGQPPYYYVARSLVYGGSGSQGYAVYFGYPPTECETEEFSSSTVLELVEQALPNGGTRFEIPLLTANEAALNKYHSIGRFRSCIPKDATEEYIQDYFIPDAIRSLTNPGAPYNLEWAGWYMGADKDGNHHFAFWHAYYPIMLE